MTTAPHRTPNAATLVRLVATRELTTRLRDRTFIISTVVMLAIVGLSVALPLIFARDADRPQLRLATVGSQAAAVGEVAREAGQAAIERSDERRDTGPASERAPSTRAGDVAVPTAELTLVPVATLAEAQERVRSEDVDAALVPAGDGLSVVGDNDVDAELAQLIAVAAQAQQLDAALTAAGVTAAEAGRVLAFEPPGQQLLNPDRNDAEPALFLGFVFAALFFITSFGFGMLIAQSVVEEKQSRVVELLVAAMPVRALLAGKVLGNAALALGQVVLLLAVGLAAASATGQADAVSLLLRSSGWFLIFFTLGFVMLSCLWAAAGALSARQEDLQATTTPMQFLVLTPFLLSFYVTDSGRWLTLLSYLPFTSPLTMPRRLMMGDAAWWEPVLAAGLIAVTAAALVVFASRLYQGGLLRTATRTSVRAAWAREPARDVARPGG